ncbi:MAG: VWA domain-containing protein [Acidobacteriota bacterium]
MRTFHIALAGLLLSAALPAVGPKPEKTTVRETASASLVEVPVHVISRDGKPVRGLTAADFEVEDDGRRQAITAVDVVDLNRSREVDGLSSELPAASRRHLLFLFDLTYATPAEIVRAREAATRFIVSGLDPEDLAAVATTSVEQGARLQMTFTADRRQLVRAISSVGLPSQDEEHAYDPLAFVFSLPGDPTTNSSVQEQTRGTSSIIDPTSSTRLYAAMAQKDADDYAVTRVGRHLGSMGSLAAALDSVQGRKTIVYFSEGFDGRLLSGSVARSKSTESVVSENNAMFSGQFWTFDVDRRWANGPLHRDLSDTVDLLRRSDCIVYAVDIAGLKGEGDTSLGSAAGRGEESLFALAHGTGGEVLKNTNDLSAQLKRISERTSLTYVLAFQAPQTGQDGHFHSLKVRVKRKGMRVSARAGYYETKSFQSMTPLQRMLSAADVITQEKQEGTLPLELLALSFGGEKISRVPVLLQIPGAAFTSVPAGQFALELYVYITGEDGRVADFFTRVVSVDTAASGERLRRAGLVFYGTCRLVPGKYRVRAYVRDGRDGRFGFRVAALDVPENSSAAMRALPPLFVDAEDGVRLRDHAAGAPIAGEAEPFRVGNTAFVPRIVPTVVAGGTSRVCLMLYRKTPGQAMSPFEIQAEVVDADGRARRPARLSLIGRSDPDAEGLVKMLLDFSAIGLPTGDYSLRVIFRDARDERLQSESEARFHVS